jgi:hypothetical protein
MHLVSFRVDTYLGLVGRYMVRKQKLTCLYWGSSYSLAPTCSVYAGENGQSYSLCDSSKITQGDNQGASLVVSWSNSEAKFLSVTIM